MKNYPRYYADYVQKLFHGRFLELDYLKEMKMRVGGALDMFKEIY